MQPSAFMSGVVLTADQIRSRGDHDRVPTALRRLGGVPTTLPFERTAGDEIQGVLTDGTAAVEALMALVRLQHWRVGVGVGGLDEPLPSSTRAGRGSAFVAARRAVEAAHRGPQGLAVRGPESQSGPGGGRRPAGDGDIDPQSVADVETVLWLLADLWRRRSPEGWQVADLRDQGLTGRECARRLDITPSAVSQRASSARYAEGRRAFGLVARGLDALLSRVSGAGV